VTIILCLLYYQLGASSLVGAAISILVLTPVQLLLAKQISKVQKSVLDATDQRLRTLAEVIQSVKVVKMLHWEQIFKTKIERQRKAELELLWKDSILWALVGTCWL
jgi:ABC-type bacteriocin/lantibiotic exporter with double-glycine peptidase domain